MVELGGEAFSPSHAIVSGLTHKELKLDIKPHEAFNTLHRLFLRNSLIKPGDMLNRRNYPQEGSATDSTKLRYFLQESYFVKPEGADPTDTDRTADPFEAVSTHLLKYLSPEVGEAFGALIEAFGTRVAEVAGMEGGRQARPLTADEVADFITPDLYDLLGQTIHELETSTFECSDLTARTLGQKRVETYKLDFWSMVVSDLGQEAYELFRAAGYDNTSALSFNLVELLENLLLGALLGMVAPNFWSVRGGFDQLPKTMMHRAKEQGATLKRQHRLLAVRRDPSSGLIALEFDVAGERPIVCHARKVIMSAPVSCFDHDVTLEGFDDELTEIFKKRRAGLASIAAGKLYMVYPRAWWSEMTDLEDDANPLEGYANTDMPSRAVYYRGHLADGRRGLMTGALTDSISSDFWDAFLTPDSNLFPGTTETERQEFGAPVHMVSACQGILERLHREKMENKIPQPELALYHEWRTHGAGWSAWKSGRNIHKEAAFLRLPFRAGSVDEGLYCCGDSVSERHGWVENTLESAEAMLREGFALEPASWIPGRKVF